MLASRPALTVLVVAVLIRVVALGAAAMVGAFPDYWEPEVLARNVLAGNGFVFPEMNTVYRAYMEPLYPGLVVAVYALSHGSAWALAVVQCALSALLTLVVYALARRTVGERSALIAAAIVAIHPGLAAYTIKFHPLVLDALLMPAVALAMLQLWQAPSRAHGALFGVALGLCVLTRPTVLVFVVLIALWMLVAPGVPFVRRHLVLGLAIAALIVSPWVVRNAVVLRAFVLTRTNTGYVLWLGNHPGTSGGAADPGDPTSTRALFESAPPELRARVLSIRDEVEQNRVLRAAALEYIRAAPVAFVARWIRKLEYFWTFPPYAGKRYATWQVALYRTFYAALAVAAILGTVLAYRRRVHDRAALTVVLLLPISVSVVQAAFYVEGRHRLAVEALLAIPAAYALERLRERLGPAIPHTAAARPHSAR